MVLDLDDMLKLLIQSLLKSCIYFQLVLGFLLCIPS